jgi:predicted transcriptional regulator
MATITVELNPTVQARLEELAEARQQPVADVVADILSTYTEQETLLEEMLEGVDNPLSIGEYDWGKPRGAEVW